MTDESSFRESLSSFRSSQSNNNNNRASTISQVASGAASFLQRGAAAVGVDVTNVPLLPLGSNSSGSESTSWFTSAPAAPPTRWDWFETCGLTRMQRYSAFAILVGLGLLCLLVSSLSLPFIVLTPSKFALPYCVGSLILFASFGFLRGFKSHFTHLFSQDRMLFTGVFLGTTFATLYCTLALQSYLLTLFFSLIQFVALIWYFASYLPGGTSGMSWMSSLMFSSARSSLLPI